MLSIFLESPLLRTPFYAFPPGPLNSANLPLSLIISTLMKFWISPPNPFESPTRFTLLKCPAAFLGVSNPGSDFLGLQAFFRRPCALAPNRGFRSTMLAPIGPSSQLHLLSPRHSFSQGEQAAPHRTVQRDRNLILSLSFFFEGFPTFDPVPFEFPSTPFFSSELCFSVRAS